MKLIFAGKRTEGSYAWDESSYCQRWQIYLKIQEIRRAENRGDGILKMIEGSHYLIWYFQALGATIGNNVCLYPNGGDPMMTEPDLVTIGHGASIDDASLIAHINTRGKFCLNPLEVGNGCVLKSNSRLLSGQSYHIILNREQQQQQQPLSYYFCEICDCINYECRVVAMHLVDYHLI